MNRIKGSVTITLTAEEVVGINDLMEKDMPKPLIEHTFRDGSTSTKCPRCDRFISVTGRGDWNYCPDCGQRLDNETIAL